MKPNVTSIETWFVLGFAALNPTYQSALRGNRRPTLVVSLPRVRGRVGVGAGPVESAEQRREAS
jgi:hypothetical protein